MPKNVQSNNIRKAFRNEFKIAKVGNIPNITAGKIIQKVGFNNPNYKKQLKAKATKFGIPQSKMGIRSFPGEVDSTSFRYKEGTQGLFTQSVKGQKPKHLIEHAIDNTMKMMTSDVSD